MNDSLNIESCVMMQFLYPATGSKTAMYNTDRDGDPNANFDPNNDEKELQYLVKWKNWSNLHNTWESEASLKEQKVNGMKKLENFMKKEEELDQWFVSYSNSCHEIIIFLKFYIYCLVFYSKPFIRIYLETLKRSGVHFDRY